MILVSTFPNQYNGRILKPSHLNHSAGDGIRFPSSTQMTFYQMTSTIILFKFHQVVKIPWLLAWSRTHFGSDFDSVALVGY